jgi:hypothetical protein
MDGKMNVLLSQCFALKNPFEFKSAMDSSNGLTVQ